MKKFAVSCIITLLVLASFILVGSFFSTLGIYLLIFIFLGISIPLLSAMLYVEILLKLSYKDMFNNTDKHIKKLKETTFKCLLTKTENVEAKYIFAIYNMINEVRIDYIFFLSIPYNTARKKSEALLLIYLKLLIYVFDGDMDRFKEEEKNVSKIFEELPSFISLHFQIGEYLILKKNKRNTDIVEDDLRKILLKEEKMYDAITEKIKNYLIKKEGEGLPPLFKNILA